MATLFVVATPIGNLEDITFRAVRILNEVDLILCEDTRVTKKILNKYEINTPTLSYHEHSKISKIDKIFDLIREGKDIALVSDAGTPTISDPGGMLVEYITKELPDIKIVPIPGASAVISALSISGFPSDRLLFLGFPPHKKGRVKFWKQVTDSQHTVAFYESKHRILKSLTELAELLPESQVIVGRELTKMYETIYRGKLNDIIEDIEQALDKA